MYARSSKESTGFPIAFIIIHSPRRFCGLWIAFLVCGEFSVKVDVSDFIVVVSLNFSVETCLLSFIEPQENKIIDKIKGYIDLYFILNDVFNDSLQR